MTLTQTFISVIKTARLTSSLTVRYCGHSNYVVCCQKDIFLLCFAVKWSLSVRPSATATDAAEWLRKEETHFSHTQAQAILQSHAGISFLRYRKD